MIKLTPFSEIAHPEEVLLKGTALLKGKWWVAFGTALGFYRDSDFIPEDTDIDVGVLASTVDIPELISAFKEHFELIRYLELNKPMQAAFRDPSGVIFDICFYYPEDGYLVSRHDENIWKDEGRLFTDLKLIETKYGTFPFPNPVKDYLTARYGNWREKLPNKSISA